jgi:hypothetical protein
MQSKKRIHLQQFGIIHLPNPDLIYIRNPERNKILCVPFHLLENLHQESFSILYFFFTLPPRGNNDGNHDPRAHICAWGGEICQVSIFVKLVCQTVRGQFFLFCQNYMDAKLVCQTVGVALTPYLWWSPDYRTVADPLCCVAVLLLQNCAKLFGGTVVIPLRAANSLIS